VQIGCQEGMGKDSWQLAGAVAVGGALRFRLETTAFA